ncbi:MAG: WhiB family transcriptional regulator [Acidimicrobiia bacterium]|nr:WhiB family transcriptional regulator [Actinomycetota bacterium]MBL6924958.1 WhiB family transcriptional regulator [Acidimicrobiia bacterium]MBL6926303.1 WhiB family transcriptional regulator [Acidimicrobiia bacterium]
MAGDLTCSQWQASAACRGPGAGEFFPPGRGERRDEKQRREVRAKAVCSQCPVLTSCLDYAVGIREVHGVWGGTNERERRALIGLSA